MLLGITENMQERKRIAVKKKIGIVTLVFILAMALPVVIYGLFQFDIVHARSSFNAEMQRPVAKVITKNGVGTAFLISPTLLLTARHVVESNALGDEVQLIFEQTPNKLQVPAKIKFIASSNTTATGATVTMDYFMNDLAVLEISVNTEIEPLVLGESEPVQNLDEVILVGYPGGDYSITKGNINSTTFQGFNLFKLDASSNPGNSGGPCILKEDNTVIGILVGGSGPGYQGENIALKINDVRKILNDHHIVIK